MTDNENARKQAHNTDETQMGAMTFKQAVEYGYIHRQGKYKGAPWICGSRQYPTWREALAAANESLAKHAPTHTSTQAEDRTNDV